MTGVQVSVVLPLHRCGPEVEECFDRLDATDLTGCEIVVVDDGSDDGTADRARAFAARRADVRLIVLPRNGGVAAARNAALRVARGAYVWCVDWDDRWEPDIVARMLARARATDADVVVCRAGRDTPAGPGRVPEVLDGLPHATVLDGPAAFDLVLRGVLRGYLWSKLVRRSLLPDDPFPAMRSQSDFCGIVPVLAAAGRVATEPALLYHHLTRAGSITNSRDPRLENFTACREVVHRVAGRTPPVPPDRRRRDGLLHYDYRFWHLATANTALRLVTSDAESAALVARSARAMRPGELARLARIAPGTAARCLLVAATGARYGQVYRAAVALRSSRRALTARTAA